MGVPTHAAILIGQSKDWVCKKGPRRLVLRPLRFGYDSPTWGGFRFETTYTPSLSAATVSFTVAILRSCSAFRNIFRLSLADTISPGLGMQGETVATHRSIEHGEIKQGLSEKAST